MSGKRLRKNSVGESIATGGSEAPTPPPHHTVFLPSPLSGSVDSRSTTSTNAPKGSVIRYPSDGPRVFYQSSSSAPASTFSSSQTSSIPLDLSYLDSSGHSWSPSNSSLRSSSFLSGTGTTLNESWASKRPRFLNSEGTTGSLYERDLRNVQTSNTSNTSNPGVQACTTLPPIPGYGPIRVTISMDLPPPPSSLYPSYTPPLTTPTSETPPAPVLHHNDLEKALDFLSPSDLRQLLRQAAHQHPDLGSSIQKTYTQKAHAEQSKTVNFVQHSNNVWHTLNTKYNFESGEKQLDSASKAVEDVNAAITAIVKEIKRESSFATKKNGIETLRKIGRTICLATGIIGDKVREWIGFGTGFVDAVMDIVGLLEKEELRMLRGEKDGELVLRLEQLDELRLYYGVFEGFGDVVRVLKRDEEGGRVDGEVPGVER